MIRLPRLYAILDPACFPGLDIMLNAASHWVHGGVRLLQYRSKSGNAETMLEEAKAIAGILGPKGAASRKAKLIMNDRADLCLAAGFDGVHLGQDDLLPESARKIVGPSRWMGVSTHNPEQVATADLTSADYIAIGPVFSTASKANPDPVVGIEGVRRARSLTHKPLVAIGGITRQNCREVIDAGADSVAVISDLVREPGKSVEAFLRILE